MLCFMAAAEAYEITDAQYLKQEASANREDGCVSGPVVHTAFTPPSVSFRTDLATCYTNPMG